MFYVKTTLKCRRILIAENQNIIYGEYIPSILGNQLTRHYRLNVLHSGYSKYDPNVNPSSTHAWIVAAGRFGHSQINDLFNVILRDRTFSYLLRDKFFDPSLVSLGYVSIDSL